MIRWITITALSLALIGTGVWGYQEHEEKNAILIQAENTYQRAFHELSFHIDLLHDKIGSTLAVSSNDRLSPQLVEIWRITSESLANVGQLPLTLLPFNKTEEFLSNIGDFTYRTAVRDLETEPLSEEEKQLLEDLYVEANEIKNELREVQYLVLENNLRWMDVQLALATQDEQADNTIIDGFETVEKRVEGFTEANVESSIIGTSSKEHKFLNVKGKFLSEDEALNKSKQLFNIDNFADASITKSGEGSDIKIYSISYNDGEKSAYMDMTEQGGNPLTLLVDRPINNKELSLNEGLDKAKEYLDQFSFEDMVVFQSSEFGKVGVYSFLSHQDDTRVFSDAIEVKIALDNGDLLGLTARNYFMNHKVRKFEEPKLTVNDAIDKVNEQVDIQEQHLAIIDDDLGEEVLTYEFLGILNDETYRIFINAHNGKEEKVERLTDTEINYSSMF